MLSPKKPLHYKPIGTLDFNSSSDTNQGFKSWLQNSVHNIISFLQYVSGSKFWTAQCR